MTTPPLIPGRRLTLERFEPGLRPGTAIQDAFDDLGEALHEVTFVVVDLETTGTSSQSDHITEIGAVKVRGGEILGEYATLVNPGVPIPPRITALTGITTSMVAIAPSIGEVLPSFIAFTEGTFVVAHNARFDMGFLRAATKEHGMPWRIRGQVDTLALARRVVTKDEAPNHRLNSLARLFGSPLEPDHRALTDARATVHVLHGLLERLGSLGVTHVDDLHTAADPIPPARRRRVSLTDDLPSGPGVYLFKGPGQEVLYVGTAKNLRRRVRQYFTSAPDRRRIGEMVDLSTTVEIIQCPTALEAQVRELRLIAEHEPAYNRRSKRPSRLPWVRLTDEALPRLSIVRSVPAGAHAIGPFPSRQAAEQAAAALEELGIRGCRLNLPLTVSATAKACVLADLGKCSAPCIDQDAVGAYSAIVDRATTAMGTDVSDVFDAHIQRLRDLAIEERFEEASGVRDRLVALLKGVHKTQRLSPWWGSVSTVAARWSTDTYVQGAWEIVVVKHGRLASSGVCHPSHDPREFAAELAEASAYVPAPTTLAGAASPEETSLIATWMETPGTRLISHDGPALAWPLKGAKAHLDRLPG